MTLDWSMAVVHAGLYLSVWKLYKQNRKNHDANVKHIAKEQYRANLMWHDFCERKGISPVVNGNDVQSN